MLSVGNVAGGMASSQTILERVIEVDDACKKRMTEKIVDFYGGRESSTCVIF